MENAQFAVGDKVKTNRYFGHADFDVDAVIDEVVTDRSQFHYVVRYTSAPLHDYDFTHARKFPTDLRPA